MALAVLRSLTTVKTGTVLFTRYLTSQSASSRIMPIISPSIIKNPWIWQKNDKISLPVPVKTQFQLPNEIRWIPTHIEEPPSIINNNTIELPPTIDSNIQKEAVRMIVIRRKKMKKHKLKKLRKRMKYEWAKLRQRRELKKEKAFQAVLIAQCKDAESFSAEQYVANKLAQFNTLTKQ